VGGDEGRFTPPSRLEARSRLGSQTANEPGASVVSSVPKQLLDQNAANISRPSWPTRRLRRGLRSLLAHGKNVVFYAFPALDADHFAHGLDLVQPIIFF
jgi:hypothetical protein